MSKPIKRHQDLQPLSREHHHSLLLCWKIRTGFKKQVEPKRIKRYADWFFDNHIQPHFEAEEQFIFPILGKDHELVKKAMSHHRRLFRLFNISNEIEKALGLIEEELEQHIRFEERILFNKIQEIATSDELELFKKHHREKQFEENTKDEFWK
ncbi:hemerythrin domain-containing protein [Marivirga sp.]|uniref:hemerythrin domain-containing protein n=1 Tax=Marivirga sp. TaxID=2018662 RepID=UPI002D7F70BA|nr:hemerythrin domain-containing protein [Marivirga sp.]HET8860751.1 hemerythrin domain-containing protein [Marivirga sp.]